MNAIIERAKKVVNFIFIVIEHLQLRLQCCIVAAIGIASKARVKIEGIAFFPFVEAQKSRFGKYVNTKMAHSRCSLRIHMKHFSFGEP